jgi:uncharacterized protein (DUF302 family)
MTTLGIRAEFEGSYEEALTAVVEALKSEGFGVLTEIDVRETLKKKLGVDFRRYKILGACNPPFAHRALQAELDVGLLLPCNVIVYEADDGRVSIRAMDPMQTIAAQGEPALAEVAREVNAKLVRAMGRISPAP